MYVSYLILLSVCLFAICASSAHADSPLDETLQGVKSFSVRVVQFNARDEAALLNSGITQDLLKNDVELPFHADVAFQQQAAIGRLNRSFLLTTWNRSMTGTVGQGRTGSIRQSVIELADLFVNAYLGQNQQSR